MAYQGYSAIRREESRGGVDIAKMSFPELLERSKDEIARVLPKHLGIERMARIAMSAYDTKPALAKCNAMSVFAAVVQSSQLGLEIGLMGEAYLVPFKGQCQLIPGYLGLIKLARQSGEVADIYAHEVRERDQFRLKLGSNRELVHEPLAGRGNFPATKLERGEVVGFYAVCLFKDGNRTFVHASTEEVNEIRDASRGYKYALAEGTEDTPWITHYVPMGKKTVIRELCKYLPKSSQLATALAMDTAANAGVPQNISLKQAADGTYEPVVPPVGREAPASMDRPPASPPARPPAPKQGANQGQGARPPAAPTPTQAPPPPASAPSQGPRQQAASRPAATPMQRASQAQATDAAVRREPNLQFAPALGKLLGDLDRCKSIDELNDVYMLAQDTLNAADMKQIDQKYLELKPRVDSNGSLFGAR